MDSCLVGIRCGHLIAIQARQAVTTPAGVRKPPETKRKSDHKARRVDTLTRAGRRVVSTFHVVMIINAHRQVLMKRPLPDHAQAFQDSG